MRFTKHNSVTQACPLELNEGMPVPEDEAAEPSSCGSAALIRGVLILQEKWTLLIVHKLLRGPVGFNELCRKAEGVNATTMSQRLASLEEAGLVEKTIHSTMPPRTSYVLTDAGRALAPVLTAIEQWSQEHMPDFK